MKVAIFALIALFGVAHSLKCFQCNSEVDQACADDFAEESPALVKAFFRNCPDKDGEAAGFCRKSKMWFEVNGETRVHRDCGYKRRENYTCYQQRADDHVVDVCQCDDEGCNAASDISINIAMTITLFFGAVLATKM